MLVTGLALEMALPWCYSLLLVSLECVHYWAGLLERDPTVKLETLVKWGVQCGVYIDISIKLVVIALLFSCLMIVC